jgi:hypothetical protein
MQAKADQAKAKKAKKDKKYKKQLNPLTTYQFIKPI